MRPLSFAALGSLAFVYLGRRQHLIPLSHSPKEVLASGLGCLVAEGLASTGSCRRLRACSGGRNVAGDRVWRFTEHLAHGDRWQK